MRSNCLITFYAHTHNTHLARFQSVGDRFIPLSAFFYKQLSQLLFLWLERSQSSQRLYLALCKYQRSISACNDQFVPLVALIIYIREYYICTYICVYVHALISFCSSFAWVAARIFVFRSHKQLFLANQSYRLARKPDD